MNKCIQLFLSAALMMYPCGLHAAEAGEQYALSRAAAQQAVCQWLNQNGYSYQIFPEPGGVLRLRSSSQTGDPWQLELRPHSPLATSVAVSSAGGTGKNAQLAELLPYLATVAAGSKEVSRPREGQQQQDGIPGPVLDQIGTVVCVRAGGPGETVQFTGFFIDKGLILCTAHDLGTTEEVSIVSTMGVHFKGEITRIDSQRDLALLQI
ncbi:serine protease Do, partial [Candidatus Electrothrix communis]